MKELEIKEMQEINGGIHPITEWFLNAIGYMGGEVAWGVVNEGSALRFVAFK